MKKILLSFLFFIFVFPVILKSQWILIDPLPQSNQLKSVYAFESNKLIAGGDNGTVVKSTNAGANWNILTGIGGPLNLINSTYFVNDNTGWCVGSGQFPNYGTIFKTTDAGGNWNMQTSNLSGDLHILYSVRFVNANTGWCAGGYGALAKTTNGGTNWLRQNSTGNTINSVFFIDINTGWIVSGLPGSTTFGDIWKSGNGGENWSEQSYGAGFQDSVLYTIFFTDNNTGWTTGFGGHIFKTTNGGTNWLRQSNTNTFALYSLYFANNSTGWAVGTLGKILKTTNGGSNWVTQVSGTTQTLNSVFFSDSNNGWIVGDNGIILKTNNGGSVSINQISNEIPDKFILRQNYPNPFNPDTKINFELPQSSLISLKVYDVLGKVVDVVINEKLEAGSYNVSWNGSNYNSGIYFYKFESKHYSETKKMLLVK